MSNLKHIYLLILCALITPLAFGQGQAAPMSITRADANSFTATHQGEGPTDPAELEAFLDDFFAEKMEELHIPGTVFTMVKDGEVFFSKGYGYADLEKQIPVDPAQTIFRAGSVSKLFTATAAMQLVEQGLLDLDADINQYLTAFQIADTYPQPVTLAQLLTHTAGFEDRVFGIMAASEADLIPIGAFLANHTASRVNPPGTVHSYSNYSYALIGHLIEEVSGVPFAQYVDENIFQPLAMAQSTFLQPLPPVLAPDLAVGYFYGQDAYDPAPFDYLQGPPAGAISSTALNMAQFMIAHLQDGRYEDTLILEEATVQQMQRQQFVHHPALPGMGFGFKERFINGQRVIGHGGDLFAYSSQMILDLERNEGFYVSSNIFSDALREDLVSAFYDHYYPPQTEAVPIQPLSLSQDDLARFSGAYRFVRHPQSTIGKLMALMPGPVPWSIQANADGTLSISPFGLEADWRYAQIEPLVFKQVAGSPQLVGGLKLDPGETLVFRENESGQVSFAFISLQNAALQKLAWYEGGEVQFGTLLTVLLIFLSTLIVWPLGSLINRLRQRPSSSTPAGRRARWLAGIVGSLNVIFFLVLMISSGPEIVFGVTPIIKGLLIIPIITTPLTLVLLGMTALAWKDSYWSLLGRLYYSLVALAALVFICWANYWNLLGWHF